MADNADLSVFDNAMVPITPQPETNWWQDPSDSGYTAPQSTRPATRDDLSIFDQALAGQIPNDNSNQSSSPRKTEALASGIYSQFADTANTPNKLVNTASNVARGLGLGIGDWRPPVDPMQDVVNPNPTNFTPNNNTESAMYGAGQGIGGILTGGGGVGIPLKMAGKAAEALSPILGGASEAGQAVARGVQTAGNAIADTPITPSSLTDAAVGGATGQVVQDNAPDSLKPIAGAVGNAVGAAASGGTNALVNYGRGRFTKNKFGYIDADGNEQTVMVTPAQQAQYQREIADKVGGKANLPFVRDQIDATLNDPKLQMIPGYKPTMSEAVPINPANGAQGPLASQHIIANQNAPDQVNQRVSDNSDASRAFINSAGQEPGTTPDIQDVSRFAQGQQARVAADAQAPVDTARANAATAAAPLAINPDAVGPATGSDIQSRIISAYDTIRKKQGTAIGQLLAGAKDFGVPFVNTKAAIQPIIDAVEKQHNGTILDDRFLQQLKNIQQNPDVITAGDAATMLRNLGDTEREMADRYGSQANQVRLMGNVQDALNTSIDNAETEMQNIPAPKNNQYTIVKNPDGSTSTVPAPATPWPTALPASIAKDTKQARDVYAQTMQNGRTGAVGALTARGADGPVLQPSMAMPAILGNKDTRLANIQQLRELAPNDPQVEQLLNDGMIQGLVLNRYGLPQIVDNTGTVKPDVVASFIQKNPEIAQAMPQLTSTLQNASTAQTAVNEAMARQAEALDNFHRDALTKFIPPDPNQNPNWTVDDQVAGMMGNPTGMKQLGIVGRKIHDAVGDNVPGAQDAAVGLQKAYTNGLVKIYGPDTGQYLSPLTKDWVDGSPPMNTLGLAKHIAANRDNIKYIMGGQGMRALEQFNANETRKQQTIGNRATNPQGGSPTATRQATMAAYGQPTQSLSSDHGMTFLQYLAVHEAEALGDNIPEKGVLRALAAAGGHAAVVAPMLIAKKIYNTVKQGNLNSMNDLRSRAYFNPDLGRALLQPMNSGMGLNRLISAMRNSSVGQLPSAVNNAATAADAGTVPDFSITNPNPPTSPINVPGGGQQQQQPSAP